MDVSVVIPAQALDVPQIAGTLRGIRDQRYDAGRVEVLVVRYGAGWIDDRPIAPPGLAVRVLSVDDASPYAARNLGFA
jgi:hypothetical protein